MRIIVLFILLNLLSVYSLADEYYVVKKFETLSEILFKLGIGPIYGKHGKLLATLKLNPELVSTKGHTLIPGARIILPRSIVPVVQNNIEKIEEPKIEIKKIHPENISRSTASVSTKSLSDFEAHISSRFVKITSEDLLSKATARFISDAGMGFKLIWAQRWSESLRTSLNYESYNVEIQDLEASSKVTLMNRKLTLKSFEFGMQYKFANSFSSESTISYGELIVNRAVSPTAIKFEKFIVPKISSGLSFLIISQDHLKLFSNAELILVLPQSQGDYSSKLGLGYRLGLGVQDNFSTFLVKGKIYYNQIPLKMNVVKFNQNEVVLMLGLVKSFGREVQ